LYLGNPSEGSHKLYLDDGADLILRRTIVASSKAPVPNAGAPNGYTQQRNTIVGHLPLLLDNGKYTTNTFRIEVAFDPESTDAEIDDIYSIIGHAVSDADFVNHRRDGSVA
jgi:hypothetical protein